MADNHARLRIAVHTTREIADLYAKDGSARVAESLRMVADQAEKGFTITVVELNGQQPHPCCQIDGCRYVDLTDGDHPDAREN